MKDECGRNIDYIRISITDLCNLRCRYCMPECGVGKKSHFDIIRFEEIIDLLKAATKTGISKVRFTGGEPLVRRGVVSLVGMIKEIPGIKEITMTTNGQLLAGTAQALNDAGLNRVNISLDTLRKDRYEFISRGGNIGNVLEGIKAAKTAGLLPVGINVVLIKGFNDDEIRDFIELTRKDEIEIRFIELMPIGECAEGFFNGRSVPNSIVLEKAPELAALPAGDEKICVYYRLPDSKGRVGLIDSLSHKFCSLCNRLRVTADAKIKPCLHSDLEINIRQMRGEDRSYENILKYAISQKPVSHRLDEDILYQETCTG